jgi:3-oxoacyl-ACP reductase-like protein
MSAKAKRPALLDLNALLVKAPAPANESALPAAPVVTAESPAPAKSAAPAKRGAAPEPENFRTSVYFSRIVHDKLREIAFEERKTITDLINEGLDHVLSSRNYATTAELREKKR